MVKDNITSTLNEESILQIIWGQCAAVWIKILQVIVGKKPNLSSPEDKLQFWEQNSDHL
jgi:hypothetical protein